MKWKWTKVLAVIFALVLVFVLAALAVAKWTDQMDANALPAVAGTWRQTRNNLIAAGAGLCTALVCLALRGRGRQPKDDPGSGEMPWEQ